jgi:hypothetical protein
MASVSEATTEFGQYRLRHALMGMTVMAVLLAAAAPWMREWAPTQWWRCGSFMGGMVLGVAMQAGSFVYGSRRNRLGRVFQQLECRYAIRPFNVPPALFIVIGSLLGICWMGLIFSSPKATFAASQAFVAFVGGCVTAQQFVLAAWRHTCGGRLAIGENGMLIEGSFVPWKNVRFAAFNPNGLPRIRAHGFSFEITTGNVEEVRSCLERHARRG